MVAVSLVLSAGGRVILLVQVSLHIAGERICELSGFRAVRGARACVVSAILKVEWFD